MDLNYIILKVFTSCRNVPLDIIRHNDSECYCKEGFGGQPIGKWPIYSFFYSYINFDNNIAKNQFKEWYKNQFYKYYNTPKKIGGMHKGSLYRLIEEKYFIKDLKKQMCLDNSIKFTIEKAIEFRVFQRMELLEDIRQNGYKKESDLIMGINKNKLIYLLGGHHRAAILKVLGYNSLPRVYIFYNKFFYYLWRLTKEVKLCACLKILRNIKHG